MKSKYLIITIILIALITIFNGKVYAETSKFSFDKESVDVTLNGTKYISYTGGTGSITWSSSDTSIATVNNGVVKGLKIGETTITAKRGEETASCKVKVIYNSLQIGGNESKNVSKVNLILNEHDTENLYATVKDNEYKEVSNAQIKWTSSDSTIVTVDSNSGKIKAVKAGTATITATAAGVTDSCEVTVYNAPEFTDFTNAKYETSLNGYLENLKISGITPKDSIGYNYYFMITPNSTKPELATKHGQLDQDTMKGKFGNLSVNAKENYIYTRKLSEYSELNQKLYLWVIQETKLGNTYYNTEGSYTNYSTKFVVEAKEIKRTTLPQLNLILQKFSIGHWTSSTSNETGNYTYINFNFPSSTENRKFTLKIGKITNTTILNKIKNNDYSGITELLTYAKNNNSIYSKELTTTSTAYFRSDEALFDGNKLLENKAYYYIYVQFDDENGKYYPIEGITLGQAWLSTSSSSWDLWAYTSSDFKWENLNSTYTPSDNKTEDSTVASGSLPKAGKNIIMLSCLISVAIIGIVTYKKYNTYKDIK